MPTLADARFRDCPYCGARDVAMNALWSQVIQTSGGQIRSWATLSCPRCAGLIALDLHVLSGAQVGNPIHPGATVNVLASVPADRASRYQVRHLPPDVQSYFDDAQVVIQAGVPDAAAVQLRRTLEAAAAHKQVTDGTLVKRIEKLIEMGLVTKDFAAVLHHIRKVGNQGAHHTDERLGSAEVERALRFTAQVLRNLFEVPGELAELEAEAPESEEGSP